jgi:hypothetical protein
MADGIYRACKQARQAEREDARRASQGPGEFQVRIDKDMSAARDMLRMRATFTPRPEATRER